MQRKHWCCRMPRFQLLARAEEGPSQHPFRRTRYVPLAQVHCMQARNFIAPLSRLVGFSVACIPMHYAGAFPPNHKVQRHPQLMMPSGGGNR